MNMNFVKEFYRKSYNILLALLIVIATIFMLAISPVFILQRFLFSLNLKFILKANNFEKVLKLVEKEKDSETKIELLNKLAEYCKNKKNTEQYNCCINQINRLKFDLTYDYCGVFGK